MKRPPPILLITFTACTILLSIVSAQDCNCVLKFQPVCGSDKHTYRNTCELECRAKSKTRLRLLYAGRCCPLIECAPVDSPLCDNYGVSHGSECLFKRAACLAKRVHNRHLTVAHAGSCSATEHQQEDCDAYSCNAHNNVIICDGNGDTMSKCEFDRLNCALRNGRLPELQLAHHGECINGTEEEEGSGDMDFSGWLEPELLAEGSGEDSGMETTTMATSSTESMESEPSLLTGSDTEKINTNELHIPLWEEPVATTLSTEGMEESGERKNYPLRMDGKKTAASLPLFSFSEDYSSAGAPARDEAIEQLPPVTVNENVSLSFSEEFIAPMKPHVSTIAVSPMRESMLSIDPSRPCSAAECDKAWMPVCDSNNKTHNNLCMFKFHACKVHRVDGSVIVVQHEGECAPPKQTSIEGCGHCDDTPDALPVCDNFNHTHNSPCALAGVNCELTAEGRELRVLVSVGECHLTSPVFTKQTEICPTTCTSEMHMVCDNEGTTHQNLCRFQIANCIARKSGSRTVPQLVALHPCRTDWEAAEEEEKEKESDETGAGFEPFSGREQPDEFECPRPKCGNESEPVCDSNGKVHSNECEFNYARCLSAKNGETLSLQADEACGLGECLQECPLAAKGEEICASDFHTYSSMCHFKKAQCGGRNMDVLFEGACSECFERQCARLPADAPDNEYVCDQNGETRSKCEFRMFQCVLKKKLQLNLTMLHEGSCCPPIEVCSKEESEPVCGSNHITYPNKCSFEIAACQNEKLQLDKLTAVKEGSCEETRHRDEESTTARHVTVTATPKTTTTTTTQATTTSTVKVVRKEIPLLDDSCPKECGNDYDPVCGSDRKTYANVCTLQRERCQKPNSTLSIHYMGECCGSSCDAAFKPVCDSEGSTHQNLCYFGYERCLLERTTGRSLDIVSFSVCDRKECPECPKTYKPVCGDNDATFVNECELNTFNCYVDKNITSSQRVSKSYDGECCPKTNCPYEFHPVCDSTGVTHANECVFKREQCVGERKTGNKISLQYAGQCCQQPCEDVYQPVCDGARTHHNMCQFRIAQCEAEKKGGVLALAYAGECCSLEKGACEKTGAVCDSDGETHSTTCRFKQKKCVLERNRIKAISIVHNGECCKIEVCPKGAMPVCDSRGGTHASRCHFQNTKCIHDKIHPDNTIHLAYDGQCCPANCEGEWDPVCDQHGSVYKNKCFFRLKNCELTRKSGSALLETPCPQRRVRHRS